MSRSATVMFKEKAAGRIFEDDAGYHFQYNKSYLESPEAVPVSLTLPLRSEEYSSNTMIPFFDGLIPEGWLLEIAEKTWKLNPRDRMGLLLACCRDCIGAVSIVPEQEGEPR
ncbi:MAG: HipA N-terminal domain-containing protein [Bacteroidota bacterium]